MSSLGKLLMSAIGELGKEEKRSETKTPLFIISDYPDIEIMIMAHEKEMEELMEELEKMKVRATERKKAFWDKLEKRMQELNLISSRDVILSIEDGVVFRLEEEKRGSK